LAVTLGIDVDIVRRWPINKIIEYQAYFAVKNEREEARAAADKAKAEAEAAKRRKSI
jgi:hypothetical protein